MQRRCEKEITMSNALRLLILEDEPLDAELEVATLEEAGYACQWERVETQAEFLACLDTPNYDAILVDYNLPSFDGLTALHLYLERDLDLPFIFVSGTMGEETAIESLKAGATDYVMKERLSRLGPAVERALREREEHRQRKRVEEELQKNRQLLNAIVNHSPAAIQVKDLQGRYLLVNNQIETMFDLQQGQAIGKTPHDIFPPETANKFLTDDQVALTAGNAVQTEDVVPLPDGMHTFIALKFPLVDAAGKLYAVAGISTDITEQKRTEEALRESRRRLRAIFDQTFQFMGVTTPDGTLTAVNQAALDFVGLEESDVVGKLFWETPWWAHSLELQERLRDAISRAASGEFIRFEVNHPAADGSLHDIDFSLKPVRDETGNVSFLIPEGRDITKRVRTEKALRIQRDLGIALSSTSDLPEALNQVLQAALQMEEIDSGGVYLFDALTGELDLAAHTGMSAEFIERVSYYGADAPNTQFVLTGKPAYMHSADFPSGMREPLQDEGLRALAVIPVIYEKHVIAAFNLASHIHDEIPVNTRNVLETIGTQVGGVIARIEAVQALQASEERYRIVSELTSDIAYAVHVEPDGTTVSEWIAGAVVRITGFNADDLKAHGGWPSLLHPDDLPLATKHLQIRLTGQPDVAEYRIITKEGKTRWLCDHGYPIWDNAQGRVVRIIGAMQDITERVQTEAVRAQAEEALRESEANLRQAQRIAHLGSWELNLENKEFTVSEEMLRIYKCEDKYTEPVSMEEFASHIHPDDRETVISALDDAITKTTPYDLEFQIVLTDGQIRVLHAQSEVIRDESGKPIKLVGTGLDVTERKQAEAQIERALYETHMRLEVSQALASAQTEEQVLDVLTEQSGLYPQVSTKILTLERSADDDLTLVSRRSSSFDSGFPEPPAGTRFLASEFPILNLITPDTLFASGDVLHDERVDENTLALATQEGWGSIAIVPITAGDNWLGIIFAASRQKGYFDSSKLALYQTLAEQGALALQIAQLQDEIKESETRFRDVALSTSDWVWETDAQSRYTYCSERVMDVLGYTVEEMLGKTPFDILPEEISHLDEIFGEIKTNKAPIVDLENRRITKDGREVYLLTSGTPILDADSNLLGYRGVDKDITKRKQAEKEREHLLTQIQEQAQRVQQIIDTVPEGVILLDTETRVVLANPLGRQDLAILADTLVGDTLTCLGGRPLVELLTSPPEGLWHEVSAEGQTFQVIARPIEEGSTLKGWVLVIRDVTQQREVERRVQQQERLAAVGQLAAGIAHDFNNIMAVIALYAGMSLRSPDVPQKIHERLEIIDQQARRASDLIQQIMDFSRRAALERGPMDLLAFIKEQVKLLQRTLPENIQVNLTHDKDEYTIHADPTRIQQAIMNLATNARDAMPQGGRLHITLDRVQIEEDDTPLLPGMRPGDWVCVRVADTGTGIPDDVLLHIYEPFFTTKEPGKGTGLGLPQVYGIIKQHEGHIDVKTNMGEGTTFILYLPVLSLGQPEVPQEGKEHLIMGKGQGILVAEDDAATRLAVVSSLELLGYQVLEATNGREALAVFEAHADQIALVLSDMVMPKMGGQALFHALKRRDPAVKVILLTGHPLQEEEMEPLQAKGLSGWLPKPPSLEQLARLIAKVLKGT
jgi:two-component system cell cycle sensor histidine kinase/response regulator CckA